MTPQQIFLLYLAAVNLFTFVIFALDKSRAVHGRWRIPEHTLLLAAFLGGSLGGLAAMYLLHHKTRNPKFYISLPLFLLFHLWLVWQLMIR